MFDVITLGSAVIDFFLATGVHERRHEICYPAGTKIAVKDLRYSTGGGGTNTSVSFSRLGLKTAWLGKIGTDVNSEVILKEMKKEKVTFLGSKCEDKTGISVILDSEEHERTVLTYKGANDDMKFSEVKLNKLKTKWFYFASMMGESFKTQEKLAEFASKKGIKIAYNPSSYQTKQGAEALKNVLKNTEVLILNKEEAQMLSGSGDFLKKLRELGPNIVCVTNGKEETVVYDGKHKYSANPHDFTGKERTGAGDAFASTLVAGIIKGESMELCLQLATTNSESVIKYYGAKNILLTWKAALKELRKNPVKVTKEVY
ncbi:carbohydrate kinase family protein [Candidatus Woesearchaeota archaeon]|nr:carbohydrate kinase family protein [Candidatus Woesearchaeota archaeon]